jgi:hypothetical protein
VLPVLLTTVLTVVTVRAYSWLGAREFYACWR